jgi:membrane associated rhomboid family serine protease
VGSNLYSADMISLIPISDANPTRRFPLITIALIVANVISFFREPGFGDSLQGSLYFFRNAPVPCQLADSCPTGPIDLGPVLVRIPDRGLISFLIAILVSTFLHAGFLHIIGNMLFLWVFGNNIEDFLGPVKYLTFYLLGGIAAALAHILTHASSILPTVGASGAVAAVMGAYLVLYPRARVNVLVPIIIIFTVIRLPAFAVLGLWFVYQFLIGAQEASGATAVAWMAHVGGFAFGVIAILLLGGRPQRPAIVMRPEWRY